MGVGSLKDTIIFTLVAKKPFNAITRPVVCLSSFHLEPERSEQNFGWALAGKTKISPSGTIKLLHRAQEIIAGIKSVATCDNAYRTNVHSPATHSFVNAQIST